MANDMMQKPAVGSAPENILPVSRPSSRPHGRSLEDFCDQKTESRLLPAEEALLTAVSRGDPCDLGGTKTTNFRTELRETLSKPDVIKLAAEVVASSQQLFRPRYGLARDSQEVIENLEARVNAQSRVLRELLTELPDFAVAHAKAPKDLRARVMTEPELLRPILNDLEERFKRELWRWRQVDPTDPTTRVRAAFLRFIALGGDESAPVHEKGVRLSRAFIDGELDLTACTEVRPIDLENCFFSKSVRCPGARLQKLKLSGCRLSEIDGVRCEVNGSAFFDRGFISLGSIRLIGAVISGTFDCDDSVFKSAFEFSNGRVGGDVYLSSDFNARVSFGGTKIGGNFNCSKGKFFNRTDDGKSRAISCQGVKIGGNVFLSSGFNAEGGVSFDGAEVGGDFNCSEATFSNRTADGKSRALSCTDAKIVGNVFLSSRFNATGRVSFDSAEVGGDFSCSEATFSNRTEDGKGRALGCANAKIAGNVFLSSSFNAEGEVSFESTEVGSDLFCSEATLSNRTEDGTGFAMNCGSVKIVGNVNFDLANIEGRVFLMGAEVGGTLACENAVFRNGTSKERRPTLQCQGAKIKGNVLLRGGLNVEGGVGFAGAQIGGVLDCSSATFSNLVAVKTKLAVHHGDELLVAEEALDLSQATIDGALWFEQHDDIESVPTTINGSINLIGAHARLLVDHPNCWSKQIVQGPNGERLSCVIKLDGFTYDRFASAAPTDAKRRLLWLCRQPSEHLRSDFRPQPFEQLIKVLREMGHEADAQQISIAKLRMKRWAVLVAIYRSVVGPSQHWWGWALKPFKLISALFHGTGIFFEWIIFDLLLGGGYAKVRPVLLFLIMLFGCAWYYDRAAGQSAFVPTNPVIYNDPEIRRACAGTKEVPDIATPIDWYRCKKIPYELNPFRPLIYSVDQMIPFLQLGQKREWQPISRQLRSNLWGIAPITLPASTTLIVTWCQSVGSTMLYLFIAAILSGLIKRD
jgi:hypothetical protein